MQSNSNYPPIIGTDELAILLKRKNINIDKCLRPHTVPHSYKPTDTKQPLWITEDVVEWLRQFKETPKNLIPSAKKKGAPTKAERVARRSAVEINNSILGK